MTVLIASELGAADLALLTAPEPRPVALRLGGLRMLARASGALPAPRPTVGPVPMARRATRPDSCELPGKSCVTQRPRASRVAIALR